MQQHFPNTYKPEWCPWKRLDLCGAVSLLGVCSVGQGGTGGRGFLKSKTLQPAWNNPLVMSGETTTTTTKLCVLKGWGQNCEFCLPNTQLQCWEMLGLSHSPHLPSTGIHSRGFSRNSALYAASFPLAFTCLLTNRKLVKHRQRKCGKGKGATEEMLPCLRRGEAFLWPEWRSWWTVGFRASGLFESPSSDSPKSSTAPLAIPHTASLRAFWAGASRKTGGGGRVQLRGRASDCSRRAQRCTAWVSRAGLNSLKITMKMQVVMMAVGEEEDEKEVKREDKEKD